MTEHVATFDSSKSVRVTTGCLLTEAARQASVEIQQPCGGQGRCGRCTVRVVDGKVRQRGTVRLSKAYLDAGYTLACQTVIEGDVNIEVPPQEKIERQLTSDLIVREVEVPKGYNPAVSQTIRRIPLTLTPPNMTDQIDDWSRLLTVIRQQTQISQIRTSLRQLRNLGGAFRQEDWKVTVLLENETPGCTDCVTRLIDLKPGHVADDAPLWGVAIDIGTTTVSVWLTDLLTGKVRAQVAEYNGQIARGEDVISRIIYSSKNAEQAEEMRRIVLDTINKLIETACKRVQAQSNDIVKATVAGNSTMIHLLLGIPAQSIRLTPFVTAVNIVPTLTADEVGLNIHPDGSVDCLPGIASYVGSDISAGVLSSGMDDTEDITLFIDIGTNGEMVLGNNEWLMTCACSAGPAFEGGGVKDGMRATKGAIEEVWINSQTYEPSFRVIGDIRPRGICGSGLISLLAELFLTGVVDKSGNINLSLPTPRVREGERGAEYVIARAEETGHEQDIAITRVDIDNLLRAKAAIYAGFTILADSIGIPLETASQVLIGGSFGKYINVEKAVQIGLLPDMPWENFHFLGNTSIRGAYLALLDYESRTRIHNIAGRMTYLELSADNTFYEAFTSALFLPHTDLSRFPTVQTLIR